jgi:hypothetical protein
MSNAVSENQFNPRPPLSPEVEAQSQMIARLLFDIIRDY